MLLVEHVLVSVDLHAVITDKLLQLVVFLAILDLDCLLIFTLVLKLAFELALDLSLLTRHLVHLLLHLIDCSMGQIQLGTPFGKFLLDYLLFLVHLL